MTTRRERIDLAQSIKNQVDFILARADARNGYANAYRGIGVDKANAILTADYDRLMALIDRTADGITKTNQGVPDPVRAQQRRVINGGMLACRQCGYDRFLSRGRSLDYFSDECARCGTIASTLTETGASR
jgi:hypothetical protein